MSDIDDLLAKQEITEVIYRYCRGIDRMDAELTLSCWHEGGLAHYGRLFEGTAEGFVEWLWPVHAAMVGHRHEISNILVDVRDDRASSEAYVSVTLRVAPPVSPSSTSWARVATSIVGSAAAAAGESSTART